MLLIFSATISRTAVIVSCLRDTRSLIRCVDSDPELVAAVKAMAEKDPTCAKNMDNGYVKSVTTVVCWRCPFRKLLRYIAYSPGRK